MGKKRERTLIKIIIVFKQYNNIAMPESERSQKIDIPTYLQQLFYRLTQTLKERAKKEYINVVKSEYDLLSDGLKAQLMAVGDKDDDDQEKEHSVRLSPFLSSLVDAKKIVFHREFIWLLSDAQFKEFKYGEKDKFVMSDNQQYIYKASGFKTIFSFGVRRHSSSKYTGFRLEIQSSPKRISGCFNIAVDEAKWLSNGWEFSDLAKGQSKNIFFFEEEVLGQLKSLTLRVSIRCWS